LEPVHPPEAVQEVAFVDDQVTVVDWPRVIAVGFTDIVAVGTGAEFIVTTTDLDACPLALEQFTV
jgi:hypothetical protein